MQSPSDFELVRDVLFESNAYYAYEDRKMRTSLQRQLYRISLWRPDARMVYSEEDYESLLPDVGDDTVAVVEYTDGRNARLWRRILHDHRARVTFDMGSRCLVLFNSKRIKQNYIL